MPRGVALSPAPGPELLLGGANAALWACILQQTADPEAVTTESGPSSKDWEESVPWLS